jgi:Cys-tRNA(Pro) deacylase
VRSCSDVHNLLAEQGVVHEILHLPAPAPTAQRAARLLGVTTPEVVKSLLFEVDDAPVLVLVPGDAMVDITALAHVMNGLSVTLASGQRVLEVTGYRPGAVPPVGLAGDVMVVADPSVFASPVVYCGGGTTATMLKIRSADLAALLAPRLADVVRRG